MSNAQETVLTPPPPPSVKSEAVHYRVIQDDELMILHPQFERLGWMVPDPDMCKVVVAEVGEGKDAIICGFQVVQFVTHAEPLWIHPSMRGTGVAEGLIGATIHYMEVDCKIKRWVVMVKAGSFAARLVEKYGLRHYPGEMWVKQVPEIK